MVKTLIARGRLTEDARNGQVGKSGGVAAQMQYGAPDGEPNVSTRRAMASGGKPMACAVSEKFFEIFFRIRQIGRVDCYVLDGYPPTSVSDFAFWDNVCGVRMCIYDIITPHFHNCNPTLFLV